MGRRTGLGAAGIAVAAVGLVTLFGGVLADGPGARLSRPAAASAAPVFATPGVDRDTAAEVARLEARVATSPKDARALAELGLAYEQRGRETADPAYYPRAGEALRRARALDPASYEALTGLASLAASRHRFRDALVLARRAVVLRPESSPAYGILGDALGELGRYREAFAAFDRMGTLRPSLAAYTRVSYARELLGRPRAAIAAMRLAVEAGSGRGENLAWTLVQLGNLYFDTGRLSAAGSLYRTALRAYPGFVHAEAGVARVDAARGRYARAIVRYRRVVDTLPVPQYAIALGDTLSVSDRKADARRAYALVDVIQRLFRANGVRTETETALYDLDHNRRLASALGRARAAAAAWPSIYTQDVFAWALYKNGSCSEALERSRRALRLGTRDALKLFHRGMIELCLGRRAAGRATLRRALAVNPHFSVLYVPVAREALR